MSEALLAGARAGTVVEFGNAGTDGAGFDALDVGADWGSDRQIPADLLLEILTGRTAIQAHARGLRIRGARITGDLGWDWQRLPVPLELLDCVIDAPVDLDHAQVARLSLIRCRLPGLSAEQMTCASTVKIVGSAISGTVLLRDAVISGALLASGARLRGEFDHVDSDGARVALLGARLQVSGAVILGDGFTADGTVLLTGARIGGNLNCTAGRFHNPGGEALEALDADVTGSVLLDDGFTAEGRVRFDRARIGGDVVCDGGSLTSLESEAFSANWSDVGGGLFMRNGFRAVGRVRLVGARIGGNWSCNDGSFTSSAGTEAIHASDARIEGSVYFRNGFSSNGSVRMMGAQIGGRFGCEGATFSNPDGDALRASNLSVGGDLMLGVTGDGRAFTAAGETALNGVRVGGRLTCRGGTFSNPGGVSLNCGDATFEGSVFLGNGFQALGEVRLSNARIGGYLDCGGGAFVNPASAAKPGAVALLLVNVEVGDSVLLHRGFRAEGQVRMNRAQIGGVLECSGGRYQNPGRYALFARAIRVGAGVLFGAGFVADGSVRLTAARITGDLNCTGGTFSEDFQAGGSVVSGSFRWRQISPPPAGVVDLIRVQVGELDDDLTSWPAPGNLRLTGFGYHRISDRAPREPRDRVEWIRRQPGYTPEPYQQLAAVYRSNGQISEATTVAIAQQDDLISRGELTRPARAWAWFLGRSIGHGYRPGRAAWALLVLYVVTMGTVWLGARTDSFIQTGNTAPQPAVTASHCTDAYPCLSVPAYALENITPILNLRQGENWSPKSSSTAQWLLRDWLYLSTVIGYAGTTLLAAALSGLARSA